MFELTDKQFKNFCKRVVIDESGVLRWAGRKNSGGYGLFYLNGKNVLAHRLAYALWGDEEFNPELWVLHKTDEPEVVDPRYLYQGNVQDNVRDMWERGRANPLKGEEHPRSLITEEQAIQVRADPRHVSEIAADLGISEKSVISIKGGHTWGWLDTPLVPSARLEPQKRKPHKLTNEDMLEIANSDEQTGVLAKRFGVSKRTIQHIRKGDRCAKRIAALT